MKKRVGVEGLRVNEPGTIFGSRSGHAPREERVLGVLGWFVVCWSRGSRASVGVDCLVPCPPSVAPVGYEPKLGSLRFVFRL